jgi:hypothetical protein
MKYIQEYALCDSVVRVVVMMTKMSIMMMRRRMRMCGVQNLEQVMGEKFTCNVFEEGKREIIVAKVNLQQHFFSTGGIDIMRE